MKGGSPDIPYFKVFSQKFSGGSEKKARRTSVNMADFGADV
jgi:hypothetical protein